MPYWDGRLHLLKSHLPSDALYDATVYDINVHDFAPMGLGRMIKFIYRSVVIV